ncbi:arrestin domain-containing protein 4-like [Diorhabda sublineata]|uniref:arrestin domain-containing protein 4-like n=1 Tax=Diorhabda sublineata TaxID=1163346 RepID=UPI0024E09A3F|nr:arrestin domain-containing protein 4-like [Diorhabda sublineata]XP_056630439.1 arrestin domain-containing protein 4-like [Diorhabda sublineata]XP_056630440.1 arrestin domain-containing protein 4-like [Diorhabda sublineata]
MTLQIVIDNPGIFAPGDIVKGKVICTFHSQERIRGIKCRFRGEEETHWMQRRGKNNVRFTGKNTIISANNNFMGEGDIRPGRYEYAFAYALPTENIPSSYTHEFGSILYHIEALVDRPFAFDYRKDVTLHVVVPVSLIQSMLPLKYQEEKRVGCCCCIRGVISLDIILEKNTYLLGETVSFKIHLVNESDIEVEGLKIELTRNVHFTTHKPSTQYKVEKHPIATTERGGVRSKGQKTYNIDMTIPENTVTYNFSKCLLFKEWFAVNVTAALPVCYSNLFLEAAFEVGHVILRTSNQIESSTVETEPQNNITPIGQAPPDNTKQLPPSYDDVIKRR